MKYEVEPDRSGAACAACGSTTEKRRPALVAPQQSARPAVRVMLCDDFKACNRRSGVYAAAITGRVSHA